MYKEVLRSIEGVDIYPVISLALFFLFFSFMMFRVAKMKKKDVQYLSSMPTTEDKADNNEYQEK